MRNQIARTVEGTRFKVKSGRITAKVRKYGSFFVHGSMRPPTIERGDLKASNLGRVCRIRWQDVQDYLERAAQREEQES